MRLSQSGLPISLVGTALSFGDVPEVTPQVRTLEEMRPLLYNQTATSPSQLYFMYRDVGYNDHKRRGASYDLRYDITVLVPGTVGGEYVKTAGHYHPDSGTAGLTYPEVYEVIYGTAHYLLQRPGTGGAEAVRLVEAVAGTRVIVPPGWGHVTINAGDTPLVMSNVTERHFKSVYAPYAERHGAAYYEIVENDRSFLVPNEHYEHHPEPVLATPADMGGPALPDQPLYTTYAEQPELLTWLVRPWEFNWG